MMFNKTKVIKDLEKEVQIQRTLHLNTPGQSMHKVDVFVRLSVLDNKNCPTQLLIPLSKKRASDVNKLDKHFG